MGLERRIWKLTAMESFRSLEGLLEGWAFNLLMIKYNDKMELNLFQIKSLIQ